MQGTGLGTGLDAIGEAQNFKTMFDNKPIWEAYSKTKEQKSLFYLATQAVDVFISSQKNTDLQNASFRAIMINFVMDGSLPKGNIFMPNVKAQFEIMKYGKKIFDEFGIPMNDQTQKYYDYLKNHPDNANSSSSVDYSFTV